MMYINVKLFGTADIPTELWGYVKTSGAYVRDGVGKYTIGYYTAEYDRNNGEDYDEESYTDAKAFDAWLISNGCKMGEVVFFEHGTITPASKLPVT